MTPELFQAPVEMDEPQSEPVVAQPTEPIVDNRTVDIPVEDVTVKVTEINQPAQIIRETAHQRAEREFVAKEEQRKREFVEAVMAARQSEEKPVVPQPVHPAISERTRQEMDMGRKMNQHWEAVKAARPVVVPSAAEQKAAGGTTPVFRPADYVPDPKKGQGVIQGRNLQNA